jgi:hypothetical protein
VLLITVALNVLYAVIPLNGKYIIMAESGFTGQAYGQAKAQEEALAAMPLQEDMGPTPPVPTIPGGDGPITRPSQYPNQSVMAPANPVPRAKISATNTNVARILPALLPLASSPYASPSTRRIVRAMQQMIPGQENDE